MDRTHSIDRVSAEREYYRTKFEDARLTMKSDGTWLSDLAMCDVDENWLEVINDQLIGIGSAELHDYNQDMHAAIVAARQEFFEGVLGWGDTEHPMHEIYQQFREKSPTLNSLATTIITFRRLGGRRKYISGIIKESPELLLLDPLDPSADVEVGETSYRQQKAYLTTEAMGAIARYDAIHIQPGKQKVKTVAVSPVARQANTRYLATAGVEEEYRKNLSRYSPEETDLLLKLFANYGIDGIRVINAGAKGLSKGLSTVQSRLEGLDELGLNPASVVNSHNGALSLNTDYIREKVPVVQTFLDRLKSDMSATRLINEKPKILARSASQLLAVSDMLEGSTDLIGHPAKDIEPFARHSIDTSFATLACKAQNSELVYAQDLERTKKLISADEQRQHNLERLHDTTVRQILSDRAIHAYMTARPLTEQERTAYPELASL